MIVPRNNQIVPDAGPLDITPPEQTNSIEAGEVIGAAFRQENPIASFVSQHRAANDERDPTHNPWDQIKGTVYEPHYERFTTSWNAGQYEAIGSSFKVTHSSNVASITDNGVADVTILFENPVPASYTVDVRSDRSLQWNAVERTEKHCRIKFEGEEPKFVRIGFLSPTLEGVRTDLAALEHKAATADNYLELAKRSGETAESLSKILADFAGARKSAENENVSQNRLDELERSVLDIGQRMAQLSTVPAPASLGGQLLIEKLGRNVFRVWLKVPMAKVPSLTFTELPEGVSGRIIDATKTSFIVEFTPKSLPVESFGFFANARLS
jgi:hypothetical protein